MADSEELLADVLIVDDEPDVAKIIAMNLEFGGYQVRIAHNGLEALEEVARKKPDCILLDIMMPVMDGWEVMRTLKADPAKAEIPVIVVTARQSDVDRIKGFSGGAVEYITKPFNPETLKDYVARTLQSRHEDADEEIRRDRIDRLQTSMLYHIAETLISTLEIGEILEIIVEQLLALFDMDICAISLLSTSGRKLQLARSRSISPLGPDELSAFDITLARLRENLGADPVDLSGPQDVSTMDFSTAGAGGIDRRSKSLYMLPLQVKDRFTGAIFLGKDKLLQFSEEERELLSAIGNLVAIAIENARLYDDLRYDKEVHKQLLQQVMTAQEDERRRVAAELHDGVIQNLVSALFRLQLCSARTSDSQPEVRVTLDEAQDIVNGGITEMRRIIAGLRPLVLDEMGLLMALKRYVRYLQEDAPLSIDFEPGDTELPALTPDAETALFRIVQEGANNILKHSGCSHARVAMDFSDHELILEIEDDGSGFELPGIQHRATHGFGLVGMRERAESLGGTLEVESCIGEGTSITVRIPMQAIVKED